MSTEQTVEELREAFDKVVNECAGPVKKRRGRPPKVQPEGIDANPELVTVPEAPRKRPRPSAPALATEIINHVLDSYDWKPGEFSVLLTAMRYIPRMGRHWAERTRRK